MKLSWPTAIAALAVATTVEAIGPISSVGNKLFTPDGKQFFVKGIAYQLSPDDPLIDTEQCKRDVELMKELGPNTIRVYHVDADKNHDGCMKAFNDAGITALIDLDTFDTYIEPAKPAWTKRMHDRYAEVMDAFIKYDNVLGFFVGNEIISTEAHSQAAPFIKAAVRDMKAHRNAKNYREVPIGYSAADIAELRPMLQDYLTCGGNSSENVDFFALNSYEWCDPSTYETSGYENLQKQAKDFPVPIFFSETGCNVPGPRLFDDQLAIFGPKMRNDWSGAIVYEWIQEENRYGLIQYENPTKEEDVVNGVVRSGTPKPVQPDFDNLKEKWEQVGQPTGVVKDSYDAKHVSVRPCPEATQGGWLVKGNVKLPAVGETFTGTYESVPSATVAPTTAGGDEGTGTAANPASETQNPAAPTKVVFRGMVAGLVGVMLFFTVWF
ncbi:hypothetical protein QC762_307980 [Podospora pseudocomata]|uniref:1,3-beta-glucanosyltransferase n=1 Tax=Podospora pseudocomata TaxID=2093779 RepID=A0ABR0GK68_9PEZI|nr:hypothetical protein QC762_307980 [Podospora pseudocomata]